MFGLFEAVCLQFLNVPYRWGGDDPIAGLDCSGLAIMVTEAFGAHPGTDMTAQGLHDWLLANGGRRVEPARGALAFYGGGASRITHVAICLNDRLVVEAGGGGSKTTTLQAAIEQNAFVRIRPVGRRKDLVAVILPAYPGGLP